MTSPRKEDSPAVDLSRRSRFDLRGRMLSNAALLGGTKIIAAIMGFATLAITAKAMGDSALFGTLLFIHAYMLFFSELASFKTWQAIIRFGSDEILHANPNKLTEAFSAGELSGDALRDNPRRLAQLFKTGLVFDALAAVIAFIIAIISLELYNWLNGLMSKNPAPALSGLPEGWTLSTLIIGYCTVVLFRQLNVSIGIFRLFDKFSVLALRALVMPSVRFFGVLMAWHLDWGFFGFLCVWYAASLLSYLVLIGFGFVEIWQRGLWPLIKSETLCRRADFPELYPFLIKTNIDSTLKNFKKNFPSIAVMLILGPVAIAIYRIAEEVSRLLARGISLFDQVLFPELSRMASEVDFKTLKRTTLQTAKGIGIAGLFFSVIMIFFGETIIAIAFEESLSGAAALSVMLLIASSLVGIALPFYTVFYVLTRPGLAIWVRLFGVTSFIGLFFALAGRFGVYSIGWAAMLSAAIEVTFVFGLGTRLIKRSEKKASERAPSGPRE